MHTFIHKLSTRIRDSIGKIADFRYIVDKTVISNYYTFRYIVSTLSPTLPGRRIREVYTQNPDELVVAFEDYPGALVLHCAPEASTLFLSERASRARRNSVDLLKGCLGRRVSAVAIDPAVQTPGFGWAVADSDQASKDNALSNRRATAGPTRRNACEITDSSCEH